MVSLTNCETRTLLGNAFHTGTVIFSQKLNHKTGMHWLTSEYTVNLQQYTILCLRPLLLNF